MKSFTAVGNLENTSKVDVTEFWLLMSSRTTSCAPKAVKDLEGARRLVSLPKLTNNTTKDINIIDLLKSS